MATPTYPRTLRVGPFVVPGIVAAVAYAADEQFGTLFSFSAPSRGHIREVRFHDRDNEGLNKELWLFDSPVALAADNAAFALADADLLRVIGVLLFSTWYTATNNQIGFSPNIPAMYDLGDGTKIWGALKTKGADDIAAGSEPWLSFMIEKDTY
jgi:hypothetical protein